MYNHINIGSLDDANEVLKWLIANVEGDHIEDVTDEMLAKLVSGDQPGVATAFCKLIFSKYFFHSFTSIIIIFLCSLKIFSIHILFLINDRNNFE